MTRSTERIQRLIAQLTTFLDDHTITAENALALGHQHQAAKQHTFTTGLKGHANHYGARVHAAGIFAVVGDQQQMTLLLTGVSSGATPINLTLPDGSLPVIPQLTTWSWSAQLVARRIDATNSGGSAVAHGGLHRDTTAASTRLIGANSTAHYRWDAGGYAVAITADTTNAALNVACTGVAGYTVNWVCALTIIQTRANV